MENNKYIKSHTPAESDEGFIGNFIPLEKYESVFLFDSKFEDLKGRSSCSTTGKIYFTVGYNGLSLNCTSEGYVSTDLVSDFEDGFTAAAWIKLVSFPSKKSLGNSPIIANKKIGSDEEGIVFSVVTETKESRPTIRAEITYASGQTVAAEAPLPENSRKSWVHVILSLSNDTLSLYVDFEKVCSAEVCGGKISPSSPFIIAQDTSGEHTSAFESELDDLLIRRGAIGQSEIDSLRKYYF